MAKHFTLTMLPGQQGWKPAVVETDLVAPVDPNDIAISFGDAVEEHRAVEIMNGWEWLWGGVRDRGLLNEQFVGAVLLTGAPINSLVDASRKTSSTGGDFDENDVFLSIGANIAADTNGATQMLDSGFRMLREYANENFFNVN